MNNLDCINLNKSFFMKDEEIKVLSDIKISVSPGDLIAISGSSGAGKSTLLHLLASLDKPCSGSIVFNKKETTTLSNKELSKLRLKNYGFVYQFHHLLEDLTVLENILLPGQILNSDKGLLNKRANSLIDRIGLSKRKDHLPWKLSGGEKQRVAIARALINSPNIIFLDEPTGNLDIDNAKVIQDLLIEISKEHGIALVTATHDNNFIKSFNRIYKLDNTILREI
ncbi:ABC transporter ATP-binding protein [Gammaproteobacteria bacterium]|jgi:lipoprotein-releasing system ATP-binding protein|nr:ABC transporter ATP-binding protein [Gammaproteobacteria bacterium]MDA9342993.1 ABC transporter ATP-binding protein [Gammaproteobacteria bacterium]MDA9356147.1 ABC transporter ATP-binding protein [Gammaproteobacteria bacterium]MDC1189612.1 ABC transporter ATP-binding protein [Gammaproteobacteria bacterium]